MYSCFTDGIFSIENLQIRRFHGSESLQTSRVKDDRSVKVKYNFESTSTSLFGLYELEISIIKICVSFLLFVVLLVGATQVCHISFHGVVIDFTSLQFVFRDLLDFLYLTQRSKILLRIWMMIHALIIVLGFLTTAIAITDSHIVNNHSTLPFDTLSEFFITIGFSLWFFAVVLSLHEDLEIEGRHELEGNVKNFVIAKRGSITAGEKCPPYYDC